MGGRNMVNTSCTLTTLHCSKVSFLQCCHMKRYNKIFTKMWGVYSLLNHLLLVVMVMVEDLFCHFHYWYICMSFLAESFLGVFTVFPHCTSWHGCNIIKIQKDTKSVPDIFHGLKSLLKGIMCYIDNCVKNVTSRFCSASVRGSAAAS